MNYKFNNELINIYTTFGINESKQAKPDFLDIDKDGDRKESLTKAAKDSKKKKRKKNYKK